MASRTEKRLSEKPTGRTPLNKVKSAVIPVIQEQAAVSKRIVETGKVRIAKHVREHEEIVDVPYYQEEVKVEHVPINQFVDAAPDVRTEGDTTIIPILEERCVVEKRLFVTEELHIKRERHETHNPQKVRVLKEHVEVERIPPGKTAARRTASRGDGTSRTKQTRR